MLNKSNEWCQKEIIRWGTAMLTTLAVAAAICTYSANALQVLWSLGLMEKNVS